MGYRLLYAVHKEATTMRSLIRGLPDMIVPDDKD